MCNLWAGQKLLRKFGCPYHPGLFGAKDTRNPRRREQAVELRICHRCGKRPFAGDGKRQGWGKVYSWGENISMGNFFKLLEALSGINAPKRHIPFWIAKLSARYDELIARISGKTPKHTPSTMEIYKHVWAFSSEKAEQELGYTHIPLKKGLERTLDWIYKTVLVKV